MSRPDTKRIKEILCECERGEAERQIWPSHPATASRLPQINSNERVDINTSNRTGPIGTISSR